MRRVVMIHYNFPPMGGVASVRAVRLARYLPELGWTPVIVSPRQTAYHEDGALMPTDQEVWGTGSLEWALTLKRMLVARNGGNGGQSSHPKSGMLSGQSQNGNHRSRPALTALRTFVHRLVYIPDAQVGWYPFALRAARAALRARKVDVVFSSSPPVTSHLVGRRLSRETGLPWVAEFRDLWTDWWENGRWRQPIDRRIERALLASASATITVSPTYEQILAGRGARRVVTVTNGFSHLPTDSLEIDDVLTYVGTYYPQTQDLSAALDAFGALLRRGSLRGFRLRIVGDSLEQLAPAIQRSGIERSVECSGFVSHESALRLMSRSRVLLLGGPISSNDPVLRGNIAGKTFEYLASGRPILYVGDLRSDVAGILRDHPQVRLVSCGDEMAAQAALEELIGHPGGSRDQPIGKYSHRELAGHLAALLSEVAG